MLTVLPLAVPLSVLHPSPPLLTAGSNVTGLTVDRLLLLALVPHALLQSLLLTGCLLRHGVS